MLQHSHRAIVRAAENDTNCSSENSGELHQGIGVLAHATGAWSGPASKHGAVGADETRSTARTSKSHSDVTDEFWDSEDDDGVHEATLPGEFSHLFPNSVPTSRPGSIYQAEISHTQHDSLLCVRLSTCVRSCVNDALHQLTIKHQVVLIMKESA